MKPLTKLFLFSLVVGLLASVTLAQGSGTTVSRPDSTTGYRVTKSVTGVVKKLDRHSGTFVLVDEKSDQSWTFKIGESTKYRASKTVFGKKKISWSEIEAGQRVRVTFRPEGNLNYSVVEEVKVLAHKGA